MLLLANGMEFEGTALGKTGVTIGETVFNTSMTGYQEVLTDASYFGQIVAMTYPMIGNYGVNALDSKGKNPASAALSSGTTARTLPGTGGKFPWTNT